jgi:hypothetical protein
VQPRGLSARNEGSDAFLWTLSSLLGTTTLTQNQLSIYESPLHRDGYGVGAVIGA